MADYGSMKVPELKKLLQEKSLPVTGNKADLIARLQEDDKKSAPAAEDEIDYSDDEPAPAAEPAEATKTVAATSAAPAAAPATETVAATTETTSADAPAEASADKAEEEAPKEDFALHLTKTDASEEARKRAERAKRFGLVEEDSELKAKTERAKRFGIDDKELGGLDSALPERPLKRGRGGVDDGGNAKRQSVERQTGRREVRGRGRGRRGGGGGGGGDGSGRAPKGEGDGGARKSAAVDPAEKAKLEARAKRFAA